MNPSRPRRVLTIRGEAVPQVGLLEPLQLEGEEGINQLFEYRLILNTREPDIDLGALIGRELTCGLELDSPEAAEREISGLITQARYLGEAERHSRVELTLRPWLHLATLTTDCKVFQDQSPVEIIEAVLADYPFAADKRPSEASVHTDALGRIKIQFPWDRCGQKNQNSSCWVRVSSDWAGNQLGAMQLPRVGQEVLVSFLGGDPEQPIVSGRLYNQANQPPWRLPGQQALSGIRSRELSAGGGNGAGGRSNHLILDDTEQKIQAQLRSDHQHSQLGLGHLSRIEDHEGRRDERGEGFELRTDGHGVIRAKDGLLISTQGRPGARGHAKDMGETTNRLHEGQRQHGSLGELAQQHRAQEGSGADQAEVAASLKAQNEAIEGKGAEGKFPELSEPHLVLASPAGIESSTAGSTHPYLYESWIDTLALQTLTLGRREGGGYFLPRMVFE